MTIKTKFNIGNKVWFSECGVIINGEIVNFMIVVFNDKEIQIRYNILGCLADVNEKFCYATKEELLNNKK